MTSHAIRTASIFAIAFSASPIRTQTYAWIEETPATGPSARFDHSMAYDADRHRVVMFGGSNGFAFSGDTWEWDGSTWLARFSMHYPPPRIRHAMAYDPARQRVVLFGGVTISGNVLSDTWEWDGTDWAQASPATSPPARFCHAMAYDAVRQSMLLFGGTMGGTMASNVFSDTWEWDGTDWAQASPATSPPARFRHAMAYDGARQRVTLFGGSADSSTFLDDTWGWDGASWVQVAPQTTPSPRITHTMTYDAARQRVVLFGGHAFSGAKADTWEWDGTNWSEAMPVASPPARESHAMVYDVFNQRSLVFGGYETNSTQPFGDTWTGGQIGFPASAGTFGLGCGSPSLGFLPDAAFPPILGQVCSATITDAPTVIGSVMMGWSNQYYGPFSLPVTLAAIGMPGCALLQSSDILGFGTTPAIGTTLSFSFAIPNQPTLTGARVYLQAYAFAPGQNPLQVVTSNGIYWSFGDY